MSRFHVVFALLISAAGGQYAIAQDHKAQRRHVVIGYYFLSPDQINGYTENDPKIVSFPISRLTQERAKQLTHINFAFLDISPQGEVCWDPKVNRKKAADVAARLTALRKHNPGLRLLYSVGGWHYSNDQGPSVQHYRKAVATPESRKKLARSMVQWMKDLDFDGIDLDWEYPRADDAVHFSDLLKEIRLLLDKEPTPPARGRYQLTIAGAGGAFFLSRYYHLLPSIADSLDYINLMTYDLAGPWERTTNHHAPLFGDPAGPKFYNALREAKEDLAWEERVKRHPSPFALSADAAVQQHRIAGVPARKIVLGIPFYGRAFKGVAGDRGQYSSHSTEGGDPYRGDPNWLVGCPRASAEKEPRVASYAEIQAMLKGDFGYVRYFNYKTKTPWLFNAKHKLFITYDDEEAVAFKAKYIKEQKLAGAMFWHLAQDDADGSLLTALHRCLNDTTYDDTKISLQGGVRYEGKGPHQLPLKTAPAWDKTKIYQKDGVAGFQGFVWRARYYQSAGALPSPANGWDQIGRWNEKGP